MNFNDSNWNNELADLLMIDKIESFSIVYAIVEKCPFQCAICLRNDSIGISSLRPIERERMVDTLKDIGLKRLGITGGEPMILRNDLLRFMRYLHEGKIHIGLSTTGFLFTETLIQDMDQYLDDLVISIPSLDPGIWVDHFGNPKLSTKLYRTVFDLLDWIKLTGIFLEVSTVVHEQNKYQIVDIGKELLRLNENIAWRLVQYYPLGRGYSSRSRYNLDDSEFNAIFSEVEKRFGGCLRKIVIDTRQRRFNPSPFIITPNGDVVTSSDNKYQFTGYNVLAHPIPLGVLHQFHNQKQWDFIKPRCRDWGWGDL